VNWRVLERPEVAECVWCRGTGDDLTSEDGFWADDCTRCQGTGHEDGVA